MWSTVVLSTGLVLLIGCAVAVTFLLRKQCSRGFTSFGVLATSDSLLSAFIGVVLIGLALFQEDSTKNKKCSNTPILAETSTFLISFVHSFISMFLMAMECWLSAKTKNDLTRSNQAQTRKRRRLSLELVAQWLLPIVSVVILHQLTPSNMLAKVSKQEISNNACEMISLFPSGMANECYNNVNSLQEHQFDNNLTISVVQRIYDLINGSVTEIRDGTNSDALSQPQTKEEWKNMFMHLKMEPGQEYQKKEKNNEIDNFCSGDCELYSRLVQNYFSGLITLTYLISMIGTVMLHRSTANIRKDKKKKNIEENQEAQIDTIDKENPCHLKEVKMMVLSNFVTWTPSMVEKFFKKWMCNNPPQWLVAIIFIIGQLSTVIRGLMNASPSHSDRHQIKNVIMPLNVSLDAPSQELTAEPINKNTEALFQKRTPYLQGVKDNEVVAEIKY